VLKVGKYYAKMGITFSQKEYVLFYKEQEQQQLLKKSFGCEVAPMKNQTSSIHTSRCQSKIKEVVQ